MTPHVPWDSSQHDDQIRSAGYPGERGGDCIACYDLASRSHSITSTTVAKAPQVQLEVCQHLFLGRACETGYTVIWP